MQHLREKLQTTRRRLTNFAYMVGRGFAFLAGRVSEISQAIVGLSAPEPTPTQVFLTGESAQGYRARMIKEIIAEHQDAARAYEIISGTIGNMTDIHEREHYYLNEVRHLFTYVMVPNGPGRLIDVYDTCSEALACLKSWTIEPAIKNPQFSLERDRLPFDDGSVDGMLLCEVIEHFVMDPMFCLIEINRVLRPGGFIVLSTPNVASWFAVYQALQQRHPFRWPLYGVNAVNRTNSIHAREYLTSEIVLLLEAAGFDDIVITTKDYGITPPYRPIPGFDATHRGETIFCRAYKRTKPLKRFVAQIYVEDKDYEPDASTK